MTRKDGHHLEVLIDGEWIGFAIFEHRELERARRVAREELTPTEDLE